MEPQVEGFLARCRIRRKPPAGWEGGRGYHFFICQQVDAHFENKKNSLGIRVLLLAGMLCLNLFSMFMYNKRKNIAMSYLLIILHSYLWIIDFGLKIAYTRLRFKSFKDEAVYN